MAACCSAVADFAPLPPPTPTPHGSLLQRQVADLSDGGSLPEAAIHAASGTHGLSGTPRLSVLAAWHAFAAGKIGDALSGEAPQPAGVAPDAGRRASAEVEPAWAASAASEVA